MDREVRELEKALDQIWDIATNKFGLDPFTTRFEVVLNMRTARELKLTIPATILVRVDEILE